MDCKICGQELVTLFDDGEDFFCKLSKEKYGIAWCEGCKIGFSTPDLFGDDLAKMYPENFEAYVGKKGLFGCAQKWKYSDDIKSIDQYAMKQNKSICSVFEFGSGRGEFLSHYMTKKDTTQITFHGTEMSHDGCIAAQELYGIDLECIEAEKYEFKRKFDLVVMRHVLEHINDFQTVLENIYVNGLNDNGIIYIKVPCANSYEADRFEKYWLGYDLPRHRTHFTDIGLARLLENMGFKDVICIRETVPSSYDLSKQFEERGGQYKNNKILKFIRFIYYQVTLLPRKKRAGRIKVIAHK